MLGFSTRIGPMPISPHDQRTRPRKQPRQTRAQHTVGAIIEAAARILEDQGHGGFTTNVVAERAGVSIGTLYQYFPDKDALLGALIARETARLMDEAEMAVMMPSGEQGLDALIRAAVRHQLHRPRLARLLDFEEARMPLDEGTQLVRARFLAILANILRCSDFPKQPDISTAAADIAAIIRGMIDSAGERREHGPEELLTRVRRAAFGYLFMQSDGPF